MENILLATNPLLCLCWRYASLLQRQTVSAHFERSPNNVTTSECPLESDSLDLDQSVVRETEGFTCFYPLNTSIDIHISQSKKKRGGKVMREPPTTHAHTGAKNIYSSILYLSKFTSNKPLLVRLRVPGSRPRILRY